MRVSIVELGTVAPGTTEQEALTDSIETVRHAEQLGFHRAWFAEHHLSRSGASHHPELLIAAASMVTSRIRLGSGAVLMNHYSPFKVAEMFQQLEAMTPGRIDLGMGRATAGPVIDLALQQNRSQQFRPDHAQQVLETLSWLHESFPEEHPFADHPLMPSIGRIPQTWLLGSSPHGSNLAAGLGVGYVFAGFINPVGASAALLNYRRRFVARFDLTEPRAILAVNVAVGETLADGLRLANSPKGFYARLMRAGRAAGSVMVPSPEEAAGELTQSELDEPTLINDGQWPRFVAGGPAEVRATLDQMLEQTQADELMIQNLIADPNDRRRSHELIAEMFGVTPELSR